MYAFIDTSEVHELARHQSAYAAVVPARARTIVARAGFATEAAIKAEILRLDLIDTGAMVNSTSVDVDGLEFEAGPTVEYAIYQDQGTSELPANEFTGHGFDQVLPNTIREVAELGVGIR